MGSEKLAYGLLQVAHNCGALFALWPTPRLEYGRRFAWLILFAWGVQIARGGWFGVTSVYSYGETSDLSRIAVAALAVKVVAAVSGCALAASYLQPASAWTRAGARRSFQGLAALAAAALTAAALLRWFS
jgi:hypothetical protein